MADGPIPVLNSSQFNKQADGRFTVTVGNPLNQTYTNVGVKGWQSGDAYVGKDAILSVDSAGHVSTRKPDHAGTDELCSKVAGCAVFDNVFQGNPVSFLIPYDAR